MAESIRVWAKKAFSISLILNSLITVAAVTGILYGYFHAWPYWQPYSPFLISGFLLFIVAAAAIINIFPTASIGRALHTGRLLFHHYVYGGIFLLSSSVAVVAFTSVSLIMIFLINSSNITVNTCRFFILAGAALLLDDLPDVSKRVESALNKFKSGVYCIRKTIHVLQLVTGLITLYVVFAIAFSVVHNPALTFANCLTMCTLLITSITSFACVRRKTWLKITPTN